MSDLWVHPSLILILGALLLPLVPSRLKKGYLFVVPLLAFARVWTMQQGVFGQVQFLQWTLTFGRVDALSAIFGYIMALVSVIATLYGLHVKENGQHMAAWTYAAASLGAIFAGDLLTLFLFWELMALSSVFLVWYRRTPQSIASGFRYLLVHMAGGVALLAGIILHSQATGGDLSFTLFNVKDPSLAAWLVMIGFILNAAVPPLHAWLPDAYAEGTFNGSVFLSALTTKTAVYALCRGFAGLDLLVPLGVAMALYGVVYAVLENDCRRLLAYHIISQVGYMVAGVGLGTELAINGACAHAFAHILYKGLLFMGAGTLLYAAGTAKLSELGGLFRRLPWAFLWYMVAAVSISGFPLFSGFVSKTMTITGAAEAHHTWLALGMEVAAVGTFLSVGIKLPYFAWFGRPDPGIALKPVPRNMYVAMTIAGLLCFYIGVQPGFLYQLLPNPVDYVPYTPWHVLQTLLLLGFTGLGFYLLRYKLTPEAKLNLDVDYFYRLIGRLVLAIARRPVEQIDDWWTEFYNRAGLRGMMKVAGGSVWFDRSAIDGVVDGTAVGVRRIGRTTTGAQTGRLQDYLAVAVLLGLAVFAVVWFAG